MLPVPACYCVLLSDLAALLCGVAGAAVLLCCCAAVRCAVQERGIDVHIVADAVSSRTLTDRMMVSHRTTRPIYLTHTNHRAHGPSQLYAHTHRPCDGACFLFFLFFSFSFGSFPGDAREACVGRGSIRASTTSFNIYYNKVTL